MKFDLFGYKVTISLVSRNSPLREIYYNDGMSSFYQRALLPNGLQVLMHRAAALNSVTIEVAIKAGPRYEDQSNIGIAHFLEHMLFEGTRKFPTSKELALFLENKGGISSAWTSKENVVYYVKVPKWNLETAFYYLSEILFNSTLSSPDIEKEKKIIQEELSRRIDNAEVQIFDEWFEWVWSKEQTLGRSTIGSLETIQSVTRIKLQDYLRSFYQPENMVLGVAGNFNSKEVLKYCKQYFGRKSFGKKAGRFSKTQFVPKDNVVQIIQKETRQAYLMLGFVTGVHYLHEDRFPFRLVTDILSLGVSSRLFHRLVYELGLAYSAGAYSWSFTDTGLFYTYGGFSPDKIAQAIEVIVEELQKLKEETISEIELDIVKEKDTASVLFNLEPPEALADYLSTSQLLEKRVLTPEQLAIEVKKITPSKVQEISKKYFNRRNLAVTIIGPIGKKESPKIEEALKSLN